VRGDRWQYQSELLKQEINHRLGLTEKANFFTLRQDRDFGASKIFFFFLILATKQRRHPKGYVPKATQTPGKTSQLPALGRTATTR